MARCDLGAASPWTEPSDSTSGPWAPAPAAMWCKESCDMRLLTTVVGLSAMTLSGCYSKDTAPVMSHGQPVSYWMEQLKSPDAKQRKHAVTALGHVGAADPL